MNKMQSFIIFALIIYSFQSNPRKLKTIDPLSLIEEDKEKSDEIIILHTNDVHCALNDSIGYDGLMLYKKILQQKYKYVILVDAGDHIQGNYIGSLSKGLYIIEIMNKVGYDVAILGNHEFDYGVEALLNCSEKLKCGGYTCANFLIRESQKPKFKAYRIIEVGDKKIGFIGVITPLTLVKSCLNSIKDENGEYKYDMLSDEDGQKLYNKIQEYIDEIKDKEKVDYVIIINHIGDEAEVPSKYNSIDLLKNIHGVNVMIDAHTHKAYTKTAKDKEGNNVYLTQTGTRLTNIGVIQILTNGSIDLNLIDKIPEPDEEIKKDAKKIKRSNGKEVWVDTEINDLINNLTDSFSGKLNEIIGFSDFSFIINTSKDNDHHKHTCRFEECPLGNLITDSMRSFGNIEIAFKNAGAIRADLQKGNVTKKSILNVLQYSNEIVMKQIKGKDILDALELSMKYLPNPSPRFIQVSGISFKVDATKKSSVKVDENEMFVKVMGERRVYDVKVGDEELNLTRLYNISLDAYTASGGDGFSMFGEYEDEFPLGISDNDLLSDYILKDLNGIIPKNYKKNEGRITIYLKDKKKETFLQLFTFISLGISFIILILFVIYLWKNKAIYDELTNEKVEGPLYT